MLPGEVLVTAGTHPLFGQTLLAKSFQRRSGKVLLVVVLPDGTPGTISAEATNVLSEETLADPVAPTVLSIEGLRRLRSLVAAQPRRRTSRGTGQPPS